MKAQCGQAPSISPRGTARCQAMMEAAWQLLLEKGFAAVTVDDVIARSGGSRTTLYKAFGGKEGLLQAVMAAKCAEFSEELHVSLESHLPPQEALTRFATTFANRILDEDAARFMYLLMTEGKHCPSIVDTFLARGPNNTLDHLARYLARQHDARRPAHSRSASLCRDVHRHDRWRLSATVTGWATATKPHARQDRGPRPQHH